MCVKATTRIKTDKTYSPPFRLSVPLPPSLSLSLSLSSPLFPSPQEEKKQFDRCSEKYYQSLEKKLSVSSRKKESALNEVSYNSCSCEYMHALVYAIYVHCCIYVLVSKHMYNCEYIYIKINTPCELALHIASYAIMQYNK